VDDHPLALLEGADPLPGPALPRGDLRSTWQRAIRQAKETAAYAEREFAADALAVMDATDTARAVLVSLSRRAQRALLLAADHPERVVGAAFIAPLSPPARWEVCAGAPWPIRDFGGPCSSVRRSRLVG
jgi:pimeloyl-ACP methyl ester carboxylesterase